MWCSALHCTGLHCTAIHYSSIILKHLYLVWHCRGGSLRPLFPIDVKNVHKTQARQRLRGSRHRGQVRDTRGALSRCALHMCGVLYSTVQCCNILYAALTQSVVSHWCPMHKFSKLSTSFVSVWWGVLLLVYHRELVTVLFRFLPTKFEEIFSKFDHGNKGGSLSWSSWR